MAWDWRRDLVEAAAKLDGLIERLREVRGEPALMVDLVAHSAGGLVARSFVRFGSRDVLDLSAEAVRMDETATSKVRKLALIGVPNYGSIFGLQRLMRGYRVGLVGIPPEIMATMPSIYQLLPHPERDWIVDSQGNRLRRVHARTGSVQLLHRVGERLQANAGHLPSGRSRRAAQDTPSPFFPIHYVAFGCQDHSALPNDFGIRHNLLNFLLY